MAPDGSFDPERALSVTALRGSGCLIAGSVALLIPVLFLVRALATPIPEGCFEYCGLDRTLWAWAVRFGLIVWLAGALVSARSAWWRRPRGAALSVIGAAVVLLATTVVVFDVVHVRIQDGAIVSAVWAVGIGLLLPGIWQLGRSLPRSRSVRTIVSISDAAVIIAALWALVTPSGIAAYGAPPVVMFAWVAVQLCTIGLGLAAWKANVGPRWASSALIVTCVPAVLLPIAFIAPGAFGGAVLSSLPLSALAWLGAAAGWLRDATGPRGARVGSDGVENEEPGGEVADLR